MLIIKPLKPKKCKQCREPFIPARPLQAVCGYECSIKFARKIGDKSDALRKKAERKELRARKDKIKTISDHLKEVQFWANKYVRMRDGKYCISCETTADVQYAAGHYRSRGAAGHLRFNLDNLNAQCNRRCNLALSGNQIAYREGLIRKIGLERVEALENDNTPHKWSVPELQELKAKFKLMVKELQNETNTEV